MYEYNNVWTLAISLNVQLCLSLGLSLGLSLNNTSAKQTLPGLQDTGRLESKQAVTFLPSGAGQVLLF